MVFKIKDGFFGKETNELTRALQKFNFVLNRSDLFSLVKGPMDEAEAKKLIEHMNETANFLMVVAKELSGNIESRSRSKSNGDGNGDFNILNKIESKSSGNGDFNILNKIDGKTI